MNSIRYINLLSLINDNKSHLSTIKTHYITLLSELTVCGDISDDLFYTNITRINQLGVVIIAYIGSLSNNTFSLIGSGTIIIEPKIIRHGLSVGHIEDIVVKSEHRGRGIVRSILDTLKEFAIHDNCYKIVLNCSESIPNSNVYTSYGFEKKCVEMSLYF